MNLRCPHCGSELLLDVEVCPGQNIACPYCAKKFAYRDEASGGPVKMKLLRRGPGAANRGFKSFLRTRGVVCGGVGAGVLALVLLSWLLLADGEYDFSTKAVNQNECPIVNFMEFHLDDVQVGTAYLYETDRKTLLVDEVVQGRGVIVRYADGEKIRRVFVRSKDVYVDGDSLKTGFYACAGLLRLKRGDTVKTMHVYEICDSSLMLERVKRIAEEQKAKEEKARREREAEEQKARETAAKAAEEKRAAAEAFARSPGEQKRRLEYAERKVREIVPNGFDEKKMFLFDGVLSGSAILMKITNPRWESLRKAFDEGRFLDIISNADGRVYDICPEEEKIDRAVSSLGKMDWYLEILSERELSALRRASSWPVFGSHYMPSVSVRRKDREAEAAGEAVSVTVRFKLNEHELYIFYPRDPVKYELHEKYVVEFYRESSSRIEDEVKMSKITSSEGKRRTLGLIEMCMARTEALFGVNLRTSAEKRMDCSPCAGAGGAFLSEKCRECGGTGRVTSERNCYVCLGEGKTRSSVKCSVCRGTGHTQVKCSECKGRGVVPCQWCNTTKSLTRLGKKSCSTCNGKGKYQCRNCRNGMEDVSCKTCGGLGHEGRQVTCKECGGNKKVKNARSCSSCNGSGEKGMVFQRCEACNGSGH